MTVNSLSRIWKGIAICGVLAAALLMHGRVAKAEKEPIVSARVLANAGGEIELHLGPKIGVGVSYVPGFHTVDVTSNGSTVCTAKFDRTFYFGRYAFQGPKDGWYVGAAAYQERLASTSDCGQSGASGVLPMVGYQWNWDSGVNVDVGIRPGVLAVGFGF